MATKQLALRRPDNCSQCGSALDIGSDAWWDNLAKTVECLECHGNVSEVSGLSPVGDLAAAEDAIDLGRAGGSAAREYQRRHAKQEKRIEAEWGTGFVGRVVKAFAVEPHTTTAHAKGASGEQRLSAHLRRVLGDRGIVLDDRKVPNTKGNIDHLVVAPSGVWVVDAKNYKGRLEVRDLGGWRKVDERLFVAGRDQTSKADNLSWQVDPVRRVLQKTAKSEVPIHPALCFTNSEWGMFAKPFQVKGVWVTWPQRLVELMQQPVVIDAETVRELARLLSSDFPPYT